jgi:hypothetical protein
MTTGPYLYDDEPTPLHTGTPRRRNGFIVALLVGTVLVAVGMVAAMFLVKGSPTEQSEEAVGVFLAALDRGDEETAHELLCLDVRADLDAGDVPAEYRVALPGRVVGSEEIEVDGAPAVEVEVRGDDGATTSFTVINEDGPHVCGVTPTG